jgi:hypothetical protein
MPWHCPACRSVIRHRDEEELPQPGQTYRCHVCRLELVYDNDKRRLVVAPMTPNEPPGKIRKTS